MIRSFLVLALASAAVAQTTAERIDRVVSQRDARLVSVYHYGQYFHRHDHLTQGGAEEIKPEEAITRGYGRCPECLPPVTTAALVGESANGRKLSRYYKIYLRERVDPTILNVPPGAMGEIYGPPPPKVQAIPVVAIPASMADIKPASK